MDTHRAQPLSLCWHFPFSLPEHFTHSTDIVPVPLRVGKHPPSLPPSPGCLCSINQEDLCSSLVKYGHWRCCNAESFQQCAPRNVLYLISPLGFSLPQPCKPRLSLPSRGPRARHPQGASGRCWWDSLKSERVPKEGTASVFWTPKSSPVWTGAIPCPSGKGLR